MTARRGLLVGLAGVALASFAVAGPVAAQSGADDRTGPDAEALAERYAPVMLLKAQEAPCDSEGEPYAPASVEVVLGNPEVVLRQVGEGDPVLMTAPDAADLAGLGPGVYLDVPGSALDPGCTYEQDFERYTADIPPTVYAHIAVQEDRPDRLALQYWFYWYYNDWNNTHEGDWEGIQLLFDASSVAEALEESPISVGYAQHEGGERADWDDDKLEREGDRPVVYSSAGSHASYYASALYLGRSGSEGFGCDDTDGPSDRVDPEVVVLPDAVDDPTDPLAWLSYDGRWGERHSGPYNGPTGPADKARWTNPVDWHDDLRPSSVVIPAGDSSGAAIANAFCGVVEWGSRQVIELKISPWRVLISLAVVALVARWLVRRTTWGVVDPLPVRRPRRAGEIFRATFRHYGRHPLAFARIGLWYLPIAFVSGLVVALLQAVPLLGSLIDLSGRDSGASLVFALLVGGLAHLFAFVFVNAAVARMMADQELGRGIGRHPYREPFRRAGDLLLGVVRAAGVVVVLTLSVVGIPWAVRQLVRYQFLAQVVMIEGADAKTALARSSSLVRGRWWHTAVVLLVVNGAVLLIDTTVGLLLLLVTNGMPFWLLSVIVTATSALLVPIAAIAQTLLYGDAAAASEAPLDDTGTPAPTGGDGTGELVGV